jgi:hypothetical protein
MTVLPLLLLAQIDLLGPGASAAARRQLTDRPDGTGNFIEYALAASRFGTGFSTLRQYTTRRDATALVRQTLAERELPLPPENLRFARLPYQFATGSGRPIESRIAFLSGPTENFVRSFNPASQTLGSPISVPANARLLALRPNSDEGWTAHSGGAGLVALVNFREERAILNFPLRLSGNAVPVYLGFSADGRTAYLVARNPDSPAERGNVVIIDAASRSVRATVNLGTNTPSAAALNADGALLFILGTSINDPKPAEPSVIAFDTLTNTFTQIAAGVAALSQNISGELACHPDSTRLFYLNTVNSSLEQFDIPARRVTRRVNIPRVSPLLSLDLSPTGDFALVRDSNGTASYLIDIELGQIVDTTAIPAGAGFLLPRF